MFFRKVIYLVCYSRILYPFLFLLPSCFALALWLLAPHSAAVCAFSLVSSSLLFCFVSSCSFSWPFPLAFSSVIAFAALFWSFALLFRPVSLRFSLSLCRCLCFISGFQPFAVLFCLFPVAFALFCLFFLFFPSFLFS